MKTAQVVLINDEGLVLGVSRKTNHNDFGLPGGKMDPEDNDNPELTAIREAKEETGLDVYDLKLVFAIHKNGNMGFTYLAKYKGEINHNEPHVVKWVTFKTLIDGSFGRYNELVSESLDSMNIYYLKTNEMVQINTILEKIKKDKFKNIIEAIEYLFLIGYPLEIIFKEIGNYYSNIITLDKSGLTGGDLTIIESIDGCEIMFDKNSLKNSFDKDKLLLVKNNKILFVLNLKNRIIYLRDDIYENYVKDHEKLSYEDYDLIRSKCLALFLNKLNLSECSKLFTSDDFRDVILYFDKMELLKPSKN